MLEISKDNLSQTSANNSDTVDFSFRNRQNSGSKSE